MKLIKVFAIITILLIPAICINSIRILSNSYDTPSTPIELTNVLNIDFMSTEFLSLILTLGLLGIIGIGLYNKSKC